ncbi:hypothetical protein TNCV_4889641, partial [Trichonephila clavipes]
MKLERSGESIHRWVSEKKKRGDIKQIKVDSTSVSPQGCRLEDQPIPGGPCGAGRYLQATPIVLLLMLTNALSVLGADAMRI